MKSLNKQPSHHHDGLFRYGDHGLHENSDGAADGHKAMMTLMAQTMNMQSRKMIDLLLMSIIILIGALTVAVFFSDVCGALANEARHAL